LNISRLHSKVRTNVRVGGPLQILANHISGGVLPQEGHRASRSEGGEPAPGPQHEHQDSRLRLLQSDTGKIVALYRRNG